MLRILLVNIGVLNNVTMVIGCEFIPLNKLGAKQVMQEQGSRELPSIPSGPGLRLGPLTLGIGIINARQNVCSSRTLAIRLGLGLGTLAVDLCVRREHNILLSNIPVIC